MEVVLDHAVLTRIQADANRVESVDSNIDDLIHEVPLHVEIGSSLDLVVKFLLLLDVIRRFHGFATPAAQVVPRTPRRGEGAAATRGHKERTDVQKGCQTAIAEVGRRIIVVGGAPLLEQFAANPADVHVNTYLIPVEIDQFQHIHPIREAGGIDDHIETNGLAIRAKPDAIAVLIGVKAIQDLVSLCHVILGVLGRQFFVVVFAGGLGRALVGDALADEDRIDDLLAIDGVGERDAEVLVLEDLIQDLIRGVQVEVEHQRVCGVANLIEEVIVALLHIVEVDGLVLQRVGVVVHKLDFAVERAQQEQFGILQELPLDAVDVGQLVTCRIHLPVVGVAFGDGTGDVAAGRFRDAPGVDHGQLGVGPAGAVV